MRKAVAKTKRNGHPAVIAFHVRITTIEVSKNHLKDRIARADLEKLEYDIRAEAETAVEDFDAMGDEGAAAAAAETAGEFDEAMREAK